MQRRNADHDLTITILLVLGLLASATLAFQPARAAGSEPVELLEGFEDVNVGAEPRAEWFGFTATGTGAFAVSANRAQFGTKSFFASNFDTGTVEFDFAATGAISLVTSNAQSAGGAMNLNFDDFTQSPTASDAWEYKFCDPHGSGDCIGVRIIGAPDGVTAGVFAVGYHNGAPITAGLVPAPTLAEDMWYTLGVGPAGIAGQNKWYVSFAGGQVSIDLSGADAAMTNFIASKTGNPGANNPTYFDTFAASLLPLPQVAEAAATVAVEGLVAMDVHESGTAIMARYEGGDKVGTWRSAGSGSLISLGTPTDTDCNRADGISVSDIMTILLRCDIANGNPITIQLRGLNLDVYDFPGDCAPEDDCLDDIDLTSGSRCSNWPDDLTVAEIKDFAMIPLDYGYKTQENGLVDDDRAIAFVYSTTSGHVGVLEYTARTGFDECHWQRQSFAGQAPDQIAVWQPTQNASVIKILAVTGTGSTKLYDYTPRLVTGVLQGVMSTGTTLGINNGNAVSCAQSLCLIQTLAATNNLHLIDIASKAEQTGDGFPRTVTDERPRGVVLDASGQFFCYVEGAACLVEKRGDGAPFGELALPEGDFREVRAQTGFVAAWIATSTRIAYYDSATEFPDHVEAGCSFNCAPSEGAPRSPLAMGRGAIGENIPGAGNPFFGLMLSLVCILGPAAIAFKLTGGGTYNGRLHHGSPAIIGTAAYAGMCLAVYAFDFPIAVPIMVAVVAVALIVHRFWAPSGG